MQQWPTSDTEIANAIIATEGSRYTDNPLDAGGPTRYGITLRTLTEHRGRPCTPDDVRNLTLAEASQIYVSEYIVKPGFEIIGDLRLRYLLTDTGVLFGPEEAITMLQTALGTKTDGVLGPVTQQATNSYKIPQMLVNALATTRVLAHVERVEKHPSQLVFLRGWINRSLAFIV